MAVVGEGRGEVGSRLIPKDAPRRIIDRPVAATTLAATTLAAGSAAIAPRPAAPRLGNVLVRQIGH
ncbi:MAG: hypothetical protein ACREE9_20750 [Stellaceae bacterium]